MKPVRNQYRDLGAETYYRQHGGEYRNPHFPQVEALLRQNEYRIDYSSAMDFSCGSGEVSMVIRQLGYSLPTASDPFTGKAYCRHFGVPCLPLSFEDIVRHGLSPHGPFSTVICSFAMHLCSPQLLFPLAYQLFRRSPQLIIITPHKRPALERYDGVRLDFVDYTLTKKGKKVFLKGYSYG